MSLLFVMWFYLNGQNKIYHDNCGNNSKNNVENSVVTFSCSAVFKEESVNRRAVYF